MVKQQNIPNMKGPKPNPIHEEFEKHADGILFVKILITFLSTLIVIACFVWLGLTIYLNLPGDPEILNPIIIKPPILDNQTSGQVRQFYPNMKFNHNQLSYYIDVGCSQDKRERVIKAFDELENDIGIISFFPTQQNPDIEVSCSEDAVEAPEEDYFIAGEGGAREIIQTGRYNIITNGTILLHQSPDQLVKCNWPNVELHELLHVFGFDHTDNPKSLMYPYLESCSQGIDREIIEILKELYSKENLPDLYFDEISVVKKRKYLDFNLSVKNSGSINAKEVYFSIVEDGVTLDTPDLSYLGDIDYGAGIFIEIKNLKLNSLNSKEMRFVIDKKNSIKEIDKENNVAKVVL